ncbi:hypothetical protein [Mucilaginibacter sp.]|uniref:hypothetical protein n=1 Tax=Mucilaginibacter sp. TaxID=1882438 RepID=UPI003B00EE6E
MEKITINELIDFRRKSDKSKKLLAFKIKNRKSKEKPKDDDSGGGNYWITSTSCISNVFKNNDEQQYDSKINELYSKLKDNQIKRIKTMYQRNIDILNTFKDFKFDELKPSGKLKYLQVPKLFKTVVVNNFPLYINPSILYSFERNGKNELGALLLIPKIEGYKKIELGMFCETLYKFLIKNYSDNYQIALDYCVVVDTINVQKIQYKELLSGDIPFLIDTTLKELNSL